MKLTNATKCRYIEPTLGSALIIVVGIILWGTPIGENWVNASYDYLFRFSSRVITNQVVLVSMDNQAYDELHQVRGRFWDRNLHAKLLKRLASDQCSLVVFDIFFREPIDPAGDSALVTALQQTSNVVLMAEQAEVTHPGLEGVHPVLPMKALLDAAHTNWGVGWLNPNLDLVVRQHWPFSAPGPCPSLPWSAARLMGAALPDKPQEQWLRYYGPDGAWTRLSYAFAMSEPTNFFRDKVVFIGNWPKTTVPDDEGDKFRTPYTRWNGDVASGMEIQATAFLNLVNHEWLRRPVWWFEILEIITVGLVLGFTMWNFRLSVALGFAVGFGLAVGYGALWLSNASNYWFPWLVSVGGQIPCAALWAVTTALFHTRRSRLQQVPRIAGYELIHPPFGEGAYGNVWLARNRAGAWRAIKTVYERKFGEDREPYEREFNGVVRFKPISDQNPGLLRVEYVSEKFASGYFYYVMELGDTLVPGWEKVPTSYRPCDLANLRNQSKGRRLELGECVRIGIVLAESLDFLHQNGLTHRDIKPQNVIFVNGQPKLADVGLIAGPRRVGKNPTMVGTPGYMPPPPEAPGTPQADIYALGMVLYVIRTGASPAHFPQVSTTLVETSDSKQFAPFNEVILKACEPQRELRYKTASEMRAALMQVRLQIGRMKTGS